MAELKTKLNDADVSEFIKNAADSKLKKEDCFSLLLLMEKVTGYQPKMWGNAIIGFGSYHYKSERSRQEGDWPLVAFSPRKNGISLYVYTGHPDHAYLLENLGKYKIGKACITIKKLSDIDQKSLTYIMLNTIDFMQKKYPKDLP